MSRHLAVALFAAVLSAGCFEIFNTTPTNPDPSISLLGGRWESSTANSTALLSSCTNFSWTVTPSSGSVVGSGAFSALCFGVLQVTGNAEMTQGATGLTWTANAVANGPGLSDCAIVLAGTATLDGDEMSIAYSGNTCQGAVSGTEKLKLKS
jgi:hypothetical protein